MLVVVHHQLIDPPTAFARGERLKSGEGAPLGSQVLQFLPSQDGSLVTCLWQSRAVEDVQAFVDETVGDASRNVCYAVEESAAFAAPLRGIATRPVTARA